MGDLVTRHDYGAELDRREVLNLVKEQAYGGAPLGGGFRHGHQQVRQILLEVAAVPYTGCGLDAELDVSDLDLERVREAAQYVHRPPQVPPTRLAQVEGVEDAPQLRRQQVRQRTPFGRLDLGRLETLVVRERAQSIDQHGLADAAQAQQHEALGGTAGEHAIHVDGHVLDQPVAAGQLGRLQAGAGSIWVVASIHRISSVGQEGGYSF